MTTVFNFDIEQVRLKKFTEQAYLDYSMYVILDRALPHISDGLKPVQRRIIYAMSELHLDSKSKHKKSARTIGDVLGKFHPHGDNACYEAMALMAQDFSFRYPFIDGQGNWGSQDDPKSFAAMRYTEARLSNYAASLLKEVNEGTVDWLPNFDGTLNEPKQLPASLPNLLLNGATGIAVGMSTDIPPHNLTEVVTACIYLLDKPKASIEKLCEYIKGPDYPTKAEIISSQEDIIDIYKSGNGTIRMRATYIIERDNIIINSLPYLSSGNKILEQIASQIQAKKLPWIVDLRDESDHESPTRLIITTKSKKIDNKKLMLHLFASTDLEKTYRVNLNVIGLNNKPATKNLHTILSEWLIYRSNTVKRRLKFHLTKIIARLHILDGLLITFLNIDEVISIIQKSENPKESLINKFSLSVKQVDSILDLRLKQLAKLEENKLQAEQESLAKERVTLEKTLNSESRLKTLLKKELLSDIKKYGDIRKSNIVYREEAVILKDSSKAKSDLISVILSTKGWIRVAKSHDVIPTNLSYKSGDNFKVMAQGNSDNSIVVISSYGQAYTLAITNLPSTRGQGDPVTSKVKSKPGESFEGLIIAEQSANIILISSAGYGFISEFKNLISRNKNGKTILTVSEDYKALQPAILDGTATHLAIVTGLGRLLIVNLSEIPIMSKGKGKRLITIKKDEPGISCFVPLNLDNTLNIITSKKKITLSGKRLKEFSANIGERGTYLTKGCRNVKSINI